MATTVGEAQIKLSFDTKGLNTGKITSEISNTGEIASQFFAKSFVSNLAANIVSSGFNKVMGAITSSLDSAISRVDTMNNFPKVMQSLGLSSEEASSSIKAMSDRLDGLPTTLNGMVSDVQKLTATMGNLNQGTVNATSLGLALNDMFLAGGKGTEAASNAMEQYNQMLAQGKPDMQSWRSILNAAPGQLKQLAKTLLGATAGQNELYEALQKGTITFDQMNEAIVRIDREGGDGFASFEKQARSATGGVGTALQNVGNRISKAVATVIDTIGGERIANAINGFSSQFGKIGVGVGNFVKDAMAGVGKFVDYLKNNTWIFSVIRTGLAGILAFEISQKVMNLWGKIQTVFKGVTAFISANPLLAVVTALSAITVGLLEVNTAETDLSKSIKETYNGYKSAKESYDSLAKSRQETLQQNMSEIDYYNDLHGELMFIVDENGKVKDGYEARAKYITKQLSDALGIEIEMNDGVIESYEEINEAVGKAIQVKYAETQLRSEEEAYNEAIKKRNSSLERQLDIKKQIREAEQRGGWAAQETVKILNEALKEEETLYMNYNSDIQRYTDDTAAFLEERYSDMSDATWSYVDNLIKSDYASQAELEEGVRQTTEKLNIVTNLYNQTGQQVYKDQMDSYTKTIDGLKEKMQTYNGVIYDGTQQAMNGASTNISQGLARISQAWAQELTWQVNEATGMAWEFRDAGNGLVQAYANGQAIGAPTAYEKMAEVVRNTIQRGQQEGARSSDIGWNMVQGIGNGFESNQWNVLDRMTGWARWAVDQIKEQMGIHSPSRVFRDEVGAMMARGLGLGFGQEMKDVSKDMAETIPTSFAGPVMGSLEIPESSATRVANRGYSLSDIYENEVNVVGAGVSIGKQEFIVNDSFDAREAGRQFMQEVRRLV